MIPEKTRWQRGESLTIKMWLEERAGRITSQWRAEIRDREGRHEDEGTALLDHFLESLTLFIPPCFGNNRETGKEVWEQATHLYGALALLRGLAAGEVVEELQLLRIVLLRLLLGEVRVGRANRP